MVEPEDLKELQEMVKIVDFAIEMYAHEDQYYCRCATPSTREVAKALYLEMADEVELSLNRLRARRQKLWNALSDLETAERNKR